jgi:hypothetical protein
MSTRTIFGISIPLFILHGMEEYFNGFYNIDSHLQFIFKPFFIISNYQTSFLIFQISFWVLLILIFIIVKKPPLWLTVIIGLIYFYELQHIIKAVEVGGYYPGLITALAFPIIAIFYWQTLIKQDIKS